MPPGQGLEIAKAGCTTPGSPCDRAEVAPSEARRQQKLFVAGSGHECAGIFAVMGNDLVGQFLSDVWVVEQE